MYQKQNYCIFYQNFHSHTAHHFVMFTEDTGTTVYTLHNHRVMLDSLKCILHNNINVLKHIYLQHYAVPIVSHSHFYLT